MSNIILFPSQVLFDKPTYKQALHVGSYKSQVRLAIVFMSTRKENSR